jgi:hypothetical protein
MGTAVSGAPEPELDAATRRFELLLEKAYAARDAGEINRLETWLWLDGPASQKGEWAAPRGHLESASTVAQLIRSAVTKG